MAFPLPLDPSSIRANFPAFAEPSLEGQAFFENAGGSYASQQVLERLEHYWRATKVQPYGAYPTSIAAGQAMDLGYQRISEALEIDNDWIHIGPSTSQNAYVLAIAFAQIIKPGEAIVLTNQDHEANSGFWRRLSAKGIEVREWKIDPESGHLDPDDLVELLDEKVRFVAFPHCSNIVGEINPAARICRIIHDAGALAIVDGVSAAPHGLPDLGEIDPDIYFFSAYKTYGPHLGVMAIRPSVAAALPNQGHHFNEHKARYRLTPAGPDHAQIAALAGIADYLEALAEIAGDAIKGKTAFRRAHNAQRAQEIALTAPLLDWLNARNDVRLIGPKTAKDRVPTISLQLATPGFDMAQQLAKHSIMAGGGHFYGQRTLEGLGINPEHGVLRLSFVHYTSSDEIERLITALDACLA
ncbi:Cysteine desulfurase [hydrothermal vent metagenome]|uniref:Cysteine desulfurase n=1 Tax=hydrothermal vent metagenome TaxID=652676 RepID=A0A3B0T7B2_9ZZZZ